MRTQFRKLRYVQNAYLSFPSLPLACTIQKVRNKPKQKPAERPINENNTFRDCHTVTTHNFDNYDVQHCNTAVPQLALFLLTRKKCSAKSRVAKLEGAKRGTRGPRFA